jgi:kanamycin nucleotidyltransferase
MNATTALGVGPEPISREDRLRLAWEIAGHARKAYGIELIAIGLYGSMARGEDGPYSDIEMFCVLRRPGAEFSVEWAAGPWKAEVDFYGEDVLLARAAAVDGRWPLTHGAYHQVKALHDPEGYFAQLRAVAAGRPPEAFAEAISATLVGELYEFVGKVRNAVAAGETLALPEWAMQMARYAAYVLGLHRRRLYTSGGRVLAEALTLPDRPAGFDALCDLVMSGRLSDPGAVAAACEALWAGLAAWAEQHGYPIVSESRIPF